MIVEQLRSEHHQHFLAAQLVNGCFQQLGVGREGDVLGLHRRRNHQPSRRTPNRLTRPALCRVHDQPPGHRAARLPEKAHFRCDNMIGSLVGWRKEAFRRQGAARRTFVGLELTQYAAVQESGYDPFATSEFIGECIDGFRSFWHCFANSENRGCDVASEIHPGRAGIRGHGAR